MAEWVKQGGVLLLMANDPANGEIEHLDLLADIFGIHFNPVLSHHVIGDNHEPRPDPGGRQWSSVSASARLFHERTHAPSRLKRPRFPVLQDRGDILMATAKIWQRHGFCSGRSLGL